MSNTQQDEWTTKEETAGGLFLKIPADSEVRVRFVGKPIKKMESFNNQPAKPRYYSRVIARTMVDGKPASEAKVFGFGTMIKNGIADFALSDDWGNPEEFDIIIKRTGAEKQTKYSLIPCPKKPLSADLKAKANEIDLVAVTTREDESSAPEDAYNPWSDEY